MSPAQKPGGDTRRTPAGLKSGPELPPLIRQSPNREVAEKLKNYDAVKLRPLTRRRRGGLLGRRVARPG